LLLIVTTPVFFHHDQKLPSLIGRYAAIPILKVKSNPFAVAFKSTMSTLAPIPFEAKHLGNFACILKANIPRIVSQAFNELISLCY